MLKELGEAMFVTQHEEIIVGDRNSKDLWRIGWCGRIQFGILEGVERIIMDARSLVTRMT